MDRARGASYQSRKPMLLPDRDRPQAPGPGQRGHWQAHLSGWQNRSRSQSAIAIAGAGEEHVRIRDRLGWTCGVDRGEGVARPGRRDNPKRRRLLRGPSGSRARPGRTETYTVSVTNQWAANVLIELVATKKEKEREDLNELRTVFPPLETNTT